MTAKRVRKKMGYFSNQGSVGTFLWVAIIYNPVFLKYPVHKKVVSLVDVSNFFSLFLDYKNNIVNNI